MTLLLLVPLLVWIYEYYVQHGSRMSLVEGVSASFVLAALVVSLMRVVYSLSHRRHWADVQQFRAAFLPERTLSFAFMVLVVVITVLTVAEMWTGNSYLDKFLGNEFSAWLTALLFYIPLQQSLVDARGLICGTGCGEEDSVHPVAGL